MLYLKWLVNKEGERIPHDEALEIFKGRSLEQIQDILKEREWRFLEVTPFRTLKEAVEFFYLDQD